MEVTSMYKTSSSSIYKSTKSRKICIKLLKILICILEISWNYQIVYSYTYIYSFFGKTTTTLYQITTVVRSSSHLFLFKEGLDFFTNHVFEIICYATSVPSRCWWPWNSSVAYFQLLTVSFVLGYDDDSSEMKHRC